MTTLGIIMLAVPFLGFAVFLYKQDGWRAVAFVYGMTIATLVWCGVAAYLLKDLANFVVDK